MFNNIDFLEILTMYLVPFKFKIAIRIADWFNRYIWTKYARILNQTDGDALRMRKRR